jgi:hypothetical protein
VELADGRVVHGRELNAALIARTRCIAGAPSRWRSARTC